MQLIIAEKPSLGRNIAAAIGPMQKRDGYLEGQGYLVSWAFGHLFSLEDVDDYAPNPDGSRRWCAETLPCFPETFRFRLKEGDGGIQKQFSVLKSLCNRPDVDTVINAGDADREGEIIVRLCVMNAMEDPASKRQMRLWLPDQTPETIRAALSSLKEERDYDSLADEGFARTYIDWLYGVNLTRYATLRTGSLLRVGRVIVPIVRAIYDRDMAIRNFVPEIYYSPVSKAETDGYPVELVGKTRYAKGDLARAEEMCRLYNETGARVTEVKSKKSVMLPGKLYSLSTLQNVLGKKYKMSMSDSLETVQKLYEAGYLTYPRTNSEYLATAEKDKVKQILAGVAKMGYPVKFKDGKQIFDDSKIESHSALTPTYKIPDVNKLTPAEKQVYSTVFRRFVAVFCAEDCVTAKAEMKIAVGDLEEFTLRGVTVLEKGWTKYDDSTVKDKMLPPLKKGDAVCVDFKPVEKETSPPKHYTIETLNQYLKNPFKEEKAAHDKAERERGEEDEREDDTEDYRAMLEGVELGTEATRTGIIDNARSSGYIQLKKDVYTILPEGEFFIRALSRLGIRMDKFKTCEMGRSLKKVYRGEMPIRASVALAEEEIREVFDSAKNGTSPDIGFMGDEIGPCPLCGAAVRRTKFGYGCSAFKEKNCKFSFNMKILGRTIPIGEARRILREGRSEVLPGFRSKKGTLFAAALKLENGRVDFDFDRGDAPAGNAEEKKG